MIQSLFNRTDFPSLTEYVYLNQASLGLIGARSTRAMHGFLDEVARHGNLNMSDEEEVMFFESLREQGADLFSCDPDELAIVGGSSEILGQIPFMVDSDPGGEILLVSSDFPALTRPWLRFAQKNEYSIRFVDDDGETDLTDTLIQAVTQKTGVIAVSSVQFATGTRVDIPRLRKAAPNSILIADATQEAGAAAIDSEEWGADAVVASGYKWLGGHGGVALARISPILVERDPALPGWMGTISPFDFDARALSFASSARRFTLSTMSYISIIGLTASLKELAAIGLEDVEKHARLLAGRLVENAEEFGWMPYRQLGDSSASSHIVCLSHPSKNVTSVFESLRKQSISCSLRHNRLRFSFAPYNNSDDIDTVISVLTSSTDSF